MRGEYITNVDRGTISLQYNPCSFSSFSLSFLFYSGPDPLLNMSQSPDESAVKGQRCQPMCGARDISFRNIPFCIFVLFHRSNTWTLQILPLALLFFSIVSRLFFLSLSPPVCHSDIPTLSLCPPDSDCGTESQLTVIQSEGELCDSCSSLGRPSSSCQLYHQVRVGLDCTVWFRYRHDR